MALIRKQSLRNRVTRWMLLNAASQLPGFINVTDRLKRLIASVSQSKQAQTLNTFTPTLNVHFPLQEPGLAVIFGHTFKIKLFDMLASD